MLDNYRLKAVFVVELSSPFKGRNHGEQSVYPSVKCESLKTTVDFTSAAQTSMSFFEAVEIKLKLNSDIVKSKVVSKLSVLTN